MFQQNYQSNLSNLKLTKELLILGKEVLYVGIYEIHLCLVNTVSESLGLCHLYHKAVKEKTDIMLMFLYIIL